MLTVTIWHSKEGVITSVQSPFNHLYDKQWFEDEQALRWIKDIDKMDHIMDDIFRDRWGKAVAATQLSSGSKALCLMKFQTEYLVYATRCGDNCVPYIEEMSQEQDVHVVLHHCMPFSDGFKFYVTDSERDVYGGADWINEFYRIKRNIQGV